MVWAVSYNTAYWNPHSVAIDDTLKLIRETPATFIAFQEVFSNYRARQLDRALDRVGWEFWRAGPVAIAWRKREWRVRRKGAFLQHRTIWRGYRGAGGGWQGRRHVVWAQLENGRRRRTAGGIYHVPSPNASRLRDRINRMEIRRARRFMDRAPMPVLLGDWNVPWQDSNMDIMYRNGYTTSFRQKRVRRPTHGRKQIDYAVYDPVDYYCRVNKVLEGYRSDHRPILVDIYPKRVR